MICNAARVPSPRPALDPDLRAASAASAGRPAVHARFRPWRPAEEAVLAGGCFWCLEHDLETVPGVIDVESGYSGGELTRPTYPQVSQGDTGSSGECAGAVRRHPAELPALLRVYWRNIDPFDRRGQFCDKGDSYRAVIFPDGAEQRPPGPGESGGGGAGTGESPASIQVADPTLQPFLAGGGLPPELRQPQRGQVSLLPVFLRSGSPAGRRSGGQGPGRGDLGGRADLRVATKQKAISVSSALRVNSYVCADHPRRVAYPPYRSL